MAVSSDSGEPLVLLSTVSLSFDDRRAAFFPTRIIGLLCSEAADLIGAMRSRVARDRHGLARMPSEAKGCVGK